MTCKLGPVHIEIKGSGRIADLMAVELGCTSDASSNANPELEIQFADKSDFPFFVPEIYASKRNVSFNRDAYSAREPVPHVIQSLFAKSKKSIVTVYPKHENLVDKLVDVGRKAKMLNDPIYTSIMSYSLFWYVVHLALMKRGCSFFHASALANRSGEAIALAGTGGSGKTSALFKLLENEEYKYLAEDFGILGADGRVYFNPKAISIYATDTSDQQRILIDYVQQKMPWAKKLKWLLLKNLLRRNPLIKARVADVLGDRVCQEGKLAKIIFLIRAEVSKPILTEITPDEMAARVLSASLRELKWMTEYLRLINANLPAGYEYPTESEISEKMRAIYQSAFLNADRRTLMLPWRSTPSEIIQVLKRERVI